MRNQLKNEPVTARVSPSSFATRQNKDQRTRDSHIQSLGLGGLDRLWRRQSAKRYSCSLERQERGDLAQVARPAATCQCNDLGCRGSDVMGSDARAAACRWRGAPCGSFRHHCCNSIRARWPTAMAEHLPLIIQRDRHFHSPRRSLASALALTSAVSMHNRGDKSC